MANRIYKPSQRLGAITHEQLSRAFARFSLGEPIAVEPVSFGLFGQNIFVTSTAGEFVFRGAPHATWQFPTEQFFAQLLFERTKAPAACPYLIDDSCEFFPWSYAIMPRMPGIAAADSEVRARLTDADRLELACAMGRNLAAMHQITMPTCGRFDAVRKVVRPVPLEDEANWPFIAEYGRVSDAPSFREIVTARIRRLLERARASNASATTDSDVDWVDSVIAETGAALDEPFQPCFVMEDYQEGNVVFSERAGVWEVSGVFDLMGCYFGDGEIDLSRTTATYSDEAPERARNFIATYVQLRPPRRGFGLRFRVYMLLDRATIWEYLQRRESEVARKLGGLRSWAERYTEIAGGFGFA